MRVNKNVCNKNLQNSEITNFECLLLCSLQILMDPLDHPATLAMWLEE